MLLKGGNGHGVLVEVFAGQTGDAVEITTAVAGSALTFVTNTIVSAPAVLVGIVGGHAKKITGVRKVFYHLMVFQNVMYSMLQDLIAMISVLGYVFCKVSPS